jgi:hypothetical protein
LFWKLGYLLSQLLEQEIHELTKQDILNLTIDSNSWIYQHCTLQINYTSYDLQ